MDLEKLRAEVEECKKCKLWSCGGKTVFGEGNPKARLFICGEGPGLAESQHGRPFIGRSGNLLTHVLEKELGIKRNTVYITNLIKHRATLNEKGEKDRPPDEEELTACTSYLLEQIEIIKPRAILTLGAPASRFFLDRDVKITSDHGKWGEFCGIPVMPSYHPSFVLRRGGIGSPEYRELVNDVLKISAVL